MLRLDHPNILKFYEFFEDSRSIYMVTELCSGGDFSQLNHGIDSPVDIRNVLKDMFMALSYCHAHNVVHRDLKFENCLISNHDGQRLVGKIIDFGMAAVR